MTDALKPYRDRIDILDDQIVSLLADRLKICGEVGAHKALHGLSVVQPKRAQAVKTRNAQKGIARGLRPEFMEKMYALIIDEACILEENILKATKRV